MDESILTSVKASLGIPEDYEHFDQQIIGYINSVFTILRQLGVGPQDEEFSISDDTTKWSDFIDHGVGLLQGYMNKQVRLMFDTSTISSYALDALKQEIAEYTWRLQVLEDPT